MNKSECRSYIRQQKIRCQGLFPTWSAELCQRVLLMPCWQSAKVVLLYHALPDEPDLQTLLDEALTVNKQVLLPVVVKDDLMLKYYKGRENLCEGAFRILEPTGEEFPISRYPEIDLALIPGMAFDSLGHRLGRGRGYYDRLLPRIPRARTLGICFPFQHLPTVPSEPHDIAVDEVV